MQLNFDRSYFQIDQDDFGHSLMIHPSNIVSHLSYIFNLLLKEGVELSLFFFFTFGTELV